MPYVLRVWGNSAKTLMQMYDLGSITLGDSVSCAVNPENVWHESLRFVLHSGPSRLQRNQGSHSPLTLSTRARGTHDLNSGVRNTFTATLCVNMACPFSSTVRRNKSDTVIGH